MWKLFIAGAVCRPRSASRSAAAAPTSLAGAAAPRGAGRGIGAPAQRGESNYQETGLVGLWVLFLSHPLVFCLHFSRAGCSDVRRSLGPNPRLWGWLDPCSPLPGGPEHCPKPGMARSDGQLGPVVIWKVLPVLWKGKYCKTSPRGTCNGLLWLCSLAVLQVPEDEVVGWWAETTPNAQTVSFKLQIPFREGALACPPAW